MTKRELLERIRQGLIDYRVYEDDLDMMAECIVRRILNGHEDDEEIKVGGTD
ncbi:MAG: hypothetical protein HPY52_10625 [Firmicutes bacterium]|nr:hypothetical protein [Bacillota bacterium]